jgi:phosphoglycerate kinase
VSMRPVADRLEELTGGPVPLAPAVIGPHVRELAQHVPPGEMLMLENVRFEAGELYNDPGLAAALTELADLYVNDAFAVSHRAYASTEGVAHWLPSAAGRLLEREVSALSAIVERPNQPLIALLGGARLSDKLSLVLAFLDHASVVCIGGRLCFPFFAAQGLSIGATPCSQADLSAARLALATARRCGCRLELPQDLVLGAPSQAGSIAPHTMDGVEVPGGWSGLDIGPRTAEQYAAEIAQAQTVF